MTVYRVEIETRPGIGDALASLTEDRLKTWFDLHPERVRSRRVIHLDLGLTQDDALRVMDALVDPVAEVGALGMLPEPGGEGPPRYVTVGLRPGVTDSVGKSVKRAAEDCLGRKLNGSAYTSTLYLFWGLGDTEIRRATQELLYNPLIERARFDTDPRPLDLEVPRAGGDAPATVESVALRDTADDELVRISSDGTLALSLEEMQAIAAHFRDRGRDPTDAELECLAQTWSEHCKHKIFAAQIEFTDASGRTETVDGLFKTYIRGATEAIQRARDDAFLVSVFHDNAGVVRFTEQDHLVYKVETHNSPSALDPYGGAMTGIVGVNRDSFGTGLGADLLTNVWGYCFADPRFDGRVPRGLMHPRRIRDGVHRGVVDGGNQSGIPYSRGFELFDDRYLGKPLVFCGTVAVMPAAAAGRPTHIKTIEPGDKVVMVGGRIGKDGIHGATFSSVELDEHAPVQAVQIGDPITQKMMFDMLAEARDRGLMSGMTDNGAGGLSSSVGEMAEMPGGARIDLALAPLKYPGLRPWEILISEAQERMTIAVRPEDVAAFLDLARRREVEATVLGEFTDSGRFEVTYGDEAVVDLPLTFLHEGVPRLKLRARLDPAPPPEPGADPEHLLGGDGLADLVARVLSSPNLAVSDERPRFYDHEVKGLSVVKPLVGIDQDVPATAAVMRGRATGNEGVVLGEGVHPFLADLDAHAMALACVDEGVRRVLCAGARLDRLAALDNFCWPDPIQSHKTPDGEHKLAQLVRCCQGLREACEAFGLPLISGKDSMKNDAVLDGVKISIPPTLLVSVIGQMQDVRRSLTLQPRAAGDELWLLGPTHDELGASEAARRLGLNTTAPPQTDLAAAVQRYAAFVLARDEGLVASAHIVGRGGLGAALAHLSLSCALGIEADLTEVGIGLGDLRALFSESTGRILLSASAGDAAMVRRVLGAHSLVRVGGVSAGAAGLVVSRGGAELFSFPRGVLRSCMAAALTRN